MNANTFSHINLSETHMRKKQNIKHAMLSSFKLQCMFREITYVNNLVMFTVKTKHLLWVMSHVVFAAYSNARLLLIVSLRMVAWRALNNHSELRERNAWIFIHKHKEGKKEDAKTMYAAFPLISKVISKGKHGGISSLITANVESFLTVIILITLHYE